MHREKGRNWWHWSVCVCECECECEKKVECRGKEEWTLVRRYDKERVLALTPIPILLRVCWRSDTKLGRGGNGD